MWKLINIVILRFLKKIIKKNEYIWMEILVKIYENKLVINYFLLVDFFKSSVLWKK